MNRRRAYQKRSASTGWLVFLVVLLLAAIIGAAIYLIRTGNTAAPVITFSAPPADEATADPTPTTAEPAPIPSVQAAPNRPDPAPQRAVDALANLPVQSRDDWDGYSREQFGQPWQVLDSEGCDARQDVLARDLSDVGRRGCNVMRGEFTDPYTGTSFTFERGWDTSGLVEIDHVVALADAWQKGAQELSLPERVAFANDLLNLIAVSRDANQDKRGLDAANWLPPDATYRCMYVARQIAVKTKWNLWLSAPEHDAMSEVLSSCPDEQLPTGETPG